MYDNGLGLIPTNPDSFPIVAKTPYTWTLGSWTLSADAIKNKLQTLAPYGTIGEVKSSGIGEVLATITPLNNMSFATWKYLIEDLGLTVKDVYAGAPIPDQPAFDPVANVSTYWEPKLKAVSDMVGSNAKKIVITFGGFALVGIGVFAYFKGRGSRPTYAKNQPTKRR